MSVPQQACWSRGTLVLTQTEEEDVDEVFDLISRHRFRGQPGFPDNAVPAHWQPEVDRLLDAGLIEYIEQPDGGVFLRPTTERKMGT